MSSAQVAASNHTRECQANKISDARAKTAQDQQKCQPGAAVFEAGRQVLDEEWCEQKNHSAANDQ